MIYSICDDLTIEKLSEEDYYLTDLSVPDRSAFVKVVTADSFELNFKYKRNYNIAFFYKDYIQGMRVVFIIMDKLYDNVTDSSMKVRLMYIVFILAGYLNIKWRTELESGYAYFKDYNYSTRGLKIIYISSIRQYLISNVTSLLSFTSEKDMVNYLYEQTGCSGVQLEYGTMTEIKGDEYLERGYSVEEMRGV